MSKLISVGYFLFLFVVCSVMAYEYGYHPSSEEFDGLMREKTWTRDLLWQERNVKKFQPKFNLEKPKDTPSEPGFGAYPLPSGGSIEKNDKLFGYTESDTIALSSEKVAVVSEGSFANKLVMQANHTTLPIFFTNPATGIVYAITELGINRNHTGLSKNDTIPIFVSKEQYERDLYLLKKSYESKCIQQARPQIIKLNRGSLVKNVNPVVVKTELTVEGNHTRVNRGKKRKNRHRKVKKIRTPKKNSSHPVEKISTLDTQLEKPNKVSLPSVFSTSQSIPPSRKHHLNSTLVKIKKVTKPSNSSQVKIHKISRRSLNLTDVGGKNLNTVSSTQSAKANALSNKITTRSLNSTYSGEKSKKILSTQIQVTSEYHEPTVKTRTPKNSIEESIHTEAPPKSLKPPCKKLTKEKKQAGHDEYDNYYDFGGTSYSDYNFDDADEGNDDDDNESSEEKDSASSSENIITDYSSLEGTIQQDDSHRLRKTTKNRIKRRRPHSDEYDDDYENDYDHDSDEDVVGLFRSLFTPVQWIMNRIFDNGGHMFNENPQPENNDNRKPKYPQYTVYNSGANGVADSDETDEDQGNSLGSWFSSWFGFRRRSGSSTTPAPLEEESGWFDSWFGYDVRTPSPNEEESDPWFFGWFNTKPRLKRTTTTTTSTPVPILTIAEPLKNPHKWIGILAQHIINSTSTNNPLIETTTENPDIPKKISYDKYQIWRLKPKDDSQVKVLDEYKRGEEGARMHWLKGPTLRGLTDVLIPPKLLVDLQGTLDFENIDHEILIFDVGKVISYEQAKQDDVPPVKPGSGKAIMSWNRYYDYDSIMKYLELIQIRNPQLVELIHIGRSYEGRPLVIAKIESAKINDKLAKKKKHKLNKKSDQTNGVFIEAGIHGREWIAPASATWMINELLRIMKNNRTNLGTEYIKNTTWYIMPIANPDSYEYSHQYDRLWKKSRSRHIAKPNGIINSAMTWLQKKKSQKVCFGVDLDCNWHYNWGKKGSSKSPCNEFFAGPTPFSEPETRAVSKFLMDHRKQIKLFTSLQAYGQIISYPNKLNSSFQSQKLDDLFDVAMVGTDGLRKNGSKSRYKVDSSNDLIEYKSGSSDYFATFEVGIPFSYTIHLADNGIYGFLLPSTYIEPTARDAFEIITGMIDYI